VHGPARAPNARSPRGECSSPRLAAAPPAAPALSYPRASWRSVVRWPPKSRAPLATIVAAEEVDMGGTPRIMDRARSLDPGHPKRSSMSDASGPVTSSTCHYVTTPSLPPRCGPFCTRAQNVGSGRASIDAEPVFGASADARPSNDAARPGSENRDRSSLRSELESSDRHRERPVSLRHGEHFSCFADGFFDRAAANSRPFREIVLMYVFCLRRGVLQSGVRASTGAVVRISGVVAMQRMVGAPRPVSTQRYPTRFS
jgi:hypothetical protein